MNIFKICLSSEQNIMLVERLRDRLCCLYYNSSKILIISFIILFIFIFDDKTKLLRNSNITYIHHQIYYPMQRYEII